MIIEGIKNLLGEDLTKQVETALIRRAAFLLIFLISASWLV